MEKKRFRFNAVDAVIVILVLAAAAVVGYVIFTEKNNVAPQAEKVRINYVMMVNEMRSVYTDKVKVGDEVYESESEKYIGKVVQVSSTASKRTGTNRSNGDQVVTELENRRDLYVTVEADAELTDNLYIVNGFNVIVGGTLSFVTPDLTQPCNIISVEAIEG